MISRTLNQSDITKAVAHYAADKWPELKRRPTLSVTFEVDKKNKVSAIVKSAEDKRKL